MPARSKFTAERRDRILEVLRVGASLRVAAAVAGVDHSTLLRWLERGKDAPEGSAYGQFYEAVRAAEAAPKVRALAIVHDQMVDNPTLAWKFIERRVDGFAPPTSPPPARWPTQPTVINLTLGDGKPVPSWGGPADTITIPLPDTATTGDDA